MQVIQSAPLVQFRRTSVHFFHIFNAWSYSTPSKTMMISIMSYGVFSYVAPYRDRKPKNRNTTIDSSI